MSRGVGTTRTQRRADPRRHAGGFPMRCRRSVLAAAMVIVWELAMTFSMCRLSFCRRQARCSVSLVANHARLASAAKATAIEILLGFVLASITGIAVALSSRASNGSAARSIR